MPLYFSLSCSERQRWRCCRGCNSWNYSQGVSCSTGVVKHPEPQPVLPAHHSDLRLYAFLYHNLFVCCLEFWFAPNRITFFLTQTVWDDTYSLLLFILFATLHRYMCNVCRRVVSKVLISKCHEVKNIYLSEWNLLNRCISSFV